MKQKLTLILTLALILSLFCGCAADTAQDAAETSAAVEDETAAPSQTDGGQSDGKVYKWSYSTPNTQGSSDGMVDQYWADRVSEVTDGHVQVTIHWASTLLNEADNFTGVKDGICDVARTSASKAGDQLPITTILATMFSNVGDPKTAYEKVYIPFTEKYPEALAEFDGLELAVYMTCENHSCIHSTEGAGLVVSPDDVKGKMVFAPNAVITDWFVNCGASPMSMDVGDWYSSFERGLCDVMFMSWSPMIGLNLYEVLPNHTLFPNGAEVTANYILINEDSFSELPEQYQQAILELQTDVQNYNCDVRESEFDDIVSLVEENGGTVYTMTEEEESVWVELAMDAVYSSLDEKEANGIPAYEMYDYIRELGESNR